MPAAPDVPNGRTINKGLHRSAAPEGGAAGRRAGRSKQAGLRAAAVPPGMVVYAVGDIHGRLDLLARLLERIEADGRGTDAERRVLVFLGDYVDRGPDSRGVIERLAAGPPPGFEARFLKGNHEALLLAALEQPAALPLWLSNGAEATLASYGLAMPQPLHGLGRRFSAALPEAHRRFLEGLELYARYGDYLFVHAGLRPGVPVECQSPDDLLWIREPFLYCDQDFGCTVVHGHTPADQPVVRPNRIGIDTLAWSSGRLTALRLSGATRAFLATG